MDVLGKIKPVCLDEGSEKFAVGCGTMRRRGDIKFRSVHLCIFPETSLDFLKKCVLTCGAMKFTHVVLEFWGMVKYDFMKELAWDFAYTKEQIKPVIDIAHAVGLEVIPMFNHFGHASASRINYGKHVVLDQNPRLATLFNDDGWVWNFEDEKVYNILKNIRKELIELCGEGSYFHLGCDEAYSFGESEEKGRILAEYLNRIQKELDEEGRRAIIWGDMLLPKNEFKNYTNGENRYTANIEDEGMIKILSEKLDRKIVIADWQYNVSETPWKSSQYFAERGFDVLCCPWQNVSSAIKTAKEENLMGIMHTTWHTLSIDFWTVIYAGMCSWNEEEAITNSELLRSYAASLVRKLAPSPGDYKKAGWAEKQTEDMIY